MPQYLLEALIEPSKQIAEGFATTVVETADGDQIDGIKIGESDGRLTLRLASGEIRTFTAKEIKRRSVSAISTMPPMGEILSLDEIRDLIAYLRSLK